MNGEFIEQRDPTRVAIEKGLLSLLAGLRARTGDEWVVASPPDRFKGLGTVRISPAPSTPTASMEDGRWPPGS